MKYLAAVFVYGTVVHACAREKLTTIQIQNYDGPIYISPSSNQWEYDNQCSKQPLYHIENCPKQVFETECTCITKNVPLNTGTQPYCPTTCPSAPTYLQAPTCLPSPTCLQTPTCIPSPTCIQGSYSAPYSFGYQDNQGFGSVDSIRPQIPYARYLDPELGSLSCGLQQAKYANQNCQCGYKYNSGCY